VRARPASPQPEIIGRSSRTPSVAHDRVEVKRDSRPAFDADSPRTPPGGQRIIPSPAAMASAIERRDGNEIDEVAS
jgi:hypothetical protein